MKILHCMFINYTDECVAGKEDRGNGCEDCFVGFFKSDFSASPCQQCPSGRTTSGTGTTSSVSCIVVGMYMYVSPSH